MSRSVHRPSYSCVVVFTVNIGEGIAEALSQNAGHSGGTGSPVDAGLF